MIRVLWLCMRWSFLVQFRHLWNENACILSHLYGNSNLKSVHLAGDSICISFFFVIESLIFLKKFYEVEFCYSSSALVQLTTIHYTHSIKTLDPRLLINNDGCRPSKSYKSAHTLVWPLSVHYPAVWRPGHVYTPTPLHSWCRAPETGAGRCCKGRNWKRYGLTCSGPLTVPRSWCTGRSHHYSDLWLVVPVTL